MYLRSMKNDKIVRQGIGCIRGCYNLYIPITKINNYFLVVFLKLATYLIPFVRNCVFPIERNSTNM